MTPSATLPSATTSGVPPFARDLFDHGAELGPRRPAVGGEVAFDRFGRALPDATAVEIDAGHPRLGSKGHQGMRMFAQVPAAQPEALLREHDDRPPFRRLVGERRELRRIGELRVADAWKRQELGRLAVAERDGARLVEQQRVHVTRGFHGPPGHRQDVVLHQAVHAGDADGRDQRADGGRNQAHQQGNQHRDWNRRAGVVREGLQRDDDQQEHQRQHGEQDVQRDLVRRLLTLGAFDERNHPVEEAVAWLRGDPDLDPVGDDARAAGDSRAIAARLADDRRRFAGDRGFVDRRHAFDDLAVGGDELAGADHDHVTFAQARRRNLFRAVAGPEPVRDCLSFRPPQRLGLGLAAPLRHRLGEVREQHREPQPERDLAREERLAASRDELLDEHDGRQDTPDLDDEHDRILELNPRVELPDRIDDRLADDARIPDRNLSRTL